MLDFKLKNHVGLFEFDKVSQEEITRSILGKVATFWWSILDTIQGYPCFGKFSWASYVKITFPKQKVVFSYSFKFGQN